jgi:hypothetical protein
VVAQEREAHGEVRNYATNQGGYRSVPVLLDDELMQQIGMRFLVTSWGAQGPSILVSGAFSDLPQHFRDAGIWHEMGHIHHKHHLQGEFSDQNQLRAARIAAIKNGQVTPQEVEADRFAVARSGKEAIIGFLYHLLDTRPSGSQSGWNDLGKQELEIRIRLVKSY